LKYTWLPIALTALAVASPSVEERLKKLEEQMTLSTTTTEMQTFGACNADGRISSENRFGVFFDVLYWHPKRSIASLGATKPAETATAFNAEILTNRLFSFSWDFGLKTGFNYQFCHGDFDLTVEYTRVMFSDSLSLNPGGSNRVEIINDLTFPDAADDNHEATSATGSWSIPYQTVTAVLGKQFFIQKFLRIMPNFGVKAAWLNSDQHYIYDRNVTGEAEAPFTIHKYITDKTQSLGPYVYIDTNWYLCKGWSLYANTGSALLFTHSRQRQRDVGNWTLTANDENYTSNKQNSHNVTFNHFINMGISYEKYVANNTQQVGCSLGYESQFYNNLFTVLAGSVNADFAAYGLTAKAWWEF
jgi:hypothetical protein